MSYFRFLGIVVAFCFVSLFLNLPSSAGQGISATQATESKILHESDHDRPFKISVDVSEITLDVVVVNYWNGRPITDLTADDFEVYQDKQQMEVTSSIYISNQTDAAARPSVVSRKDAPNLPPQFATAVLKENEVRRTIVFLIDDTSMGFQDMYYAKMSVKRFMEKQMQSGDLLSVMYTSSGNSTLNLFSSDKRQINAQLEASPARGGFYDSDDPLYRVYDSQLLIISYSIRALRDMPGRKVLLVLTGRPTIDNAMQSSDIFGAVPVNYRELYESRFERLADEALRAGVVVHMMDIRGLYCVEDGTPGEEGYASCTADTSELTAPLNPLPKKTGGLLVMDNNFFLEGIGKDVNNMLAGYYLVSYKPPLSIFETENKKDYHRVTVKVKRSDAVVHTREGFYGNAESETESDDKARPYEKIHPLQKALDSPFLHADINVSMAAGYTKDDKAGYIVRSWIHLDPKNISFIETEDGGARINFETLYVTSGVNGVVYDPQYGQYEIKIEPDKIAWVKRNGIRFLALLQVKNPGAYTVRFAVQDKVSGKFGSAYQLVEVPDLKKRGLVLSDIFMITRAEDLAWMRADVAGELKRGLFFPVFQNDEKRSPALRTFTNGDNIQTLTMLYNAETKELSRSEIETKSILYKDGKEFLSGEPKTITPDKVETRDGIPILQKLLLGAELTPGDYMLQLLVTDKKNSVKRDKDGIAQKDEGVASKILRAYLGTDREYKKDKGVASQTLDFRIVEKP